MLLICFGSIIQAQSPHPHFHNFTSDDGLPSSEIHEAFQDSKGYMWFGTDNGLSRYDGYQFKNYSGREGLKNPVVFDIKEDNTGKLWMLTMSGNIYIMDHDSIYPFEYNHLITQHQEKYYVAKEFQFDQNQKYVFVSLIHYGILMIDIQSGKVKHIKTPKSSHFVFDSLGVRMISNIYFEINTYSPTHVSPISFIFSDRRALDITLPRYNYNAGYNLQLITDSMTLSGIGGTEALFIKDELQWTKSNTFSFTCNLVYNDNIWLGTNEKNGIKIYKDTEAIKSGNFLTILDGISISSIFIDDKGGLWVTTIENGVFYSANMDHLIYDKEAGMDDDFIKSICLKDSSQMILCTWAGSIYDWDMKSNSIRKKVVNPKKDGIYNYDVYYDNPTKKLLLGPYAMILDDKGFYPLEADQYKSIQPFVGLKTISSNTWQNKCIINSSSNVLVCDLEINKIVNILYNDNNNIRHLDANFDNKGTKWVSRIDGLWIWMGDTLIRPQPMYDILRDRIEVVEFLDNWVVLGTKGSGVLLWDKINEPIEINTEVGMTSDNIENVFIEENGTIWVGTLNGLNRIRLSDNGKPKIKVFTIKHGLPTNEITKVRRQNEYIYIATAKGMMRMQDLEDNTIAPKPTIQSFNVNGKALDHTVIHHLDYNENDIEFSYLYIDFKANGNIVYRYKLHADQDWKYTKHTSLSFPNMGAGQYHLEIQAQNEDGYWSESLDQSFEVIKPFWYQWWFALLFLGTIGWISYYVYNKSVEKIKRETAYKTNLLDLERSALQAQMNPHFIFNVLHSIQSSITNNNREKASQDLAKFSKLIRSTLNNARRKEITLEEEIEYIKSYLLLEKLRFKDKFEFEVSYPKNMDTYNICIPPMLTQPFVENAIKHGIENVDSGLILVNYTILNDYLWIKIRDNGLGYDKGNSTQHPYKPVGMDITKRRLELLSPMDQQQELIIINNLVDDTGSQIGTEITIKVKIKI